MVRRVWAVGAMLTLGCNAVLGNDAHELAGDPVVGTDAGDASPEEAAAGGNPGHPDPPGADAAFAGETGEGAGPTPSDAATEPSPSTPPSAEGGIGGDPDHPDALAPTACTPGTMQACGSDATCNPGATQTCDGTGAWAPCQPAASACAPVPAGWAPVALTQTACPSGFGSAQTFVTSASAGAYECTCACSGTQSCSGTVTLNQFPAGEGPGCSGTPTARVLDVTPDCTPGGYGYVARYDGYTTSNVSYGPGPACSAAPTITMAPPVVTRTAIVCQADQTCPAGACLSASEAAELCVAAPGMNTCPSGFPNANVMAPTYDDTRSCSACECGSSLTCALTGVLLDNDGTCSTANPYNVTATSMCIQGPSDFPLNAIEGMTNTSGDGTCVQAAPSTSTGGVTLDASTTITVCCP